MNASEDKPQKPLDTQLALFKAIEKQEVAIVDGKILRVREWKIGKKLGEGATATVYLGKSLINEHQNVAIKYFKNDYFKDDLQNEANQKMMRTEAALVGRINHPNILQTLTVGMSDENKFLVMEVVSGGSLEDYIRPPKTLGLVKLIHVFFQCGLALQYSDEIGVIHRDIKPANILLTEDNQPKVTDWGSSMAKGMDKMAVSGVGSPSYMSSEQIRQAPLTHQTDIYSLGATFFEMITGERTFSAENAKDMVYKILYVEPPPISTFVTNRLPTGLEKVIRTCLKKSLEERYQTWSDYLHAMATIIYSITPVAKRWTDIDEVSAFDWVRNCGAMEKFADSELWDIIGNSEIRRFATGMAFSMTKMNATEHPESTSSFQSISRSSMGSLSMMTDAEYSKPIKSAKQDGNRESTYSFVLSGGLQTYYNGHDNRIQVLTSGDFCGNLQWFESFDATTMPTGYAINDSIILTITESELSDIHPVVRDKLNWVIRQSQNRLMQVMRHRHAKTDVQQAVKEAEMDMRLL
jgi:serine/threonine protein kinase